MARPCFDSHRLFLLLSTVDLVVVISVSLKLSEKPADRVKLLVCVPEAGQQELASSSWTAGGVNQLQPCTSMIIALWATERFVPVPPQLDAELLTPVQHCPLEGLPFQ